MRLVSRKTTPSSTRVPFFDHRDTALLVDRDFGMLARDFGIVAQHDVTGVGPPDLDRPVRHLDGGSPCAVRIVNDQAGHTLRYLYHLTNEQQRPTWQHY